MSGENSSDGFHKTRAVLGDVTNKLGKRGISFGNDSALKSRDGYCQNSENKWEGSKFAKKVCLGVEALVHEKCVTKYVDNDNGRGKQACVSPWPFSDINSLRENVILGISKVSTEIKEPNLIDCSLKLCRGNEVNQSIIEDGDARRVACISSILMPTSQGDGAIIDAGAKCSDDEGRLSSEAMQNDSLHEQFVSQPSDVDPGVDNLALSQSEEVKLSSEAMQNDSLHGQFVSQVCGSETDDFGVDNLALSQSESIDYSRLLESQESRSFGLERCIGLKADVPSNSNAAIDLIKTCTCSFCTTAAYIWSDLYYQDIKGRITALRKSQKEASILVQKSSRKQEIGEPDQGNSNKYSKLESDLMSQWRSLFLHMEGIFGRECSQLDTGLLALKDLRENCKTELESNNAAASEKQ